MGERIALEIRERAIMMNVESTMMNDNNNNNNDRKDEYIRNSFQSRLKRKFHQQQWSTACDPILNGGQGKKLFDNTQKHRRRKQAARKVKEVVMSRCGFSYKHKVSKYGGMRVQR